MDRVCILESNTVDSCILRLRYSLFGHFKLCKPMKMANFFVRSNQNKPYPSLCVKLDRKTKFVSE